MNFLQRLFSQPKVEAMPADDPQTDGNIDETEQRQPSLLAPGLHVGKLLLQRHAFLQYASRSENVIF